MPLFSPPPAPCSCLLLLPRAALSHRRRRRAQGAFPPALLAPPDGTARRRFWAPPGGPRRRPVEAAHDAVPRPRSGPSDGRKRGGKAARGRAAADGTAVVRGRSLVPRRASDDGRPLRVVAADAVAEAERAREPPPRTMPGDGGGGRRFSVDAARMAVGMRLRSRGRDGDGEREPPPRTRPRNGCGGAARTTAGMSLRTKGDGSGCSALPFVFCGRMHSNRRLRTPLPGCRGVGQGDRWRLRTDEVGEGGERASRGESR